MVEGFNLFELGFLLNNLKNLVRISFNNLVQILCFLGVTNNLKIGRLLCLENCVNIHAMNTILVHWPYFQYYTCMHFKIQTVDNCILVKSCPIDHFWCTQCVNICEQFDLF